MMSGEPRQKVLVLYQISNDKSDNHHNSRGDFNAFEMPREGAGVSLSSVKRHCHALRSLSHCGVDGYHWRVRMDDKATNSREASYSWWDIQDENARLPLKSVSLSDMETMFRPSSSSSSSYGSSSSNNSSSAMKSASGAMRSLGKAMNAVTSNAVGGDDREDPNEPRLDVIAFKLLDLVRMEDSLREKMGGGAAHSPASRRRPPAARPPAPPSQSQQQQQQQRPSAHRRSAPPQARPAPQAELLDLTGGGGGAPPPGQHNNSNHPQLRKASSAVSPTNRSQPPPRRYNSSMPHQNAPYATTSQQRPPQPKLTRAQQLKADYEKKARTQNKVWDEVDQRWVEVDPDARRKGASSEPPPPPPPQKKIVGIKLDAANAAGKSVNVQAAVHERVRDMEQAQQKAVRELQQREAEAKADADQEDAVRKRLEPKLRAWSEEYGKKKQLRALLGSLHTILWADSGWKPVSMGDLLDEKRVRRAYLKASLKVHPDKTRDLNVEKRFIAKRVFDALSQATTEFEDSK